MLGVPQAIARGRVTVGPFDQGGHPLHRHLRLPTQGPDDVRDSPAGTSSSCPASVHPPGRDFQIGNVNAAMIAAAGIVVSQARAIARTTCQLTCRQRERPTPIPTIELETTWWC